MNPEERLRAFGDRVMASQEGAGVDLHAVVLLATEGALMLEGITSNGHRDAVADAIRQAADHLAAMDFDR